MKKAVAWLPCMAFYWTGDAFARVLDRLPDHEEGSKWGRIGSVLYAIYNWCMLKSLAINDWAGLNEWTPRHGDKE